MSTLSQSLMLKSYSCIKYNAVARLLCASANSGFASMISEKISRAMGNPSGTMLIARMPSNNLAS